MREPVSLTLPTPVPLYHSLGVVFLKLKHPCLFSLILLLLLCLFFAQNLDWPLLESEGHLNVTLSHLPNRSADLKASRGAAMRTQPLIQIRNREHYDEGADYSDYYEVKRMPGDYYVFIHVLSSSLLFIIYLYCYALPYGLQCWLLCLYNNLIF